MGVTLKEFLKIESLDGQSHEGVGLAGDLVAVQNEEGTFYGKVLEGVKVHTTVVCDSGADCVNSTVDGEFKTSPKIVEFEDNGSNDAAFIQELAQIVITSDFKGMKKAFCSEICASAYLKKHSREGKVIEFSAGKGKRTFEPSVEILEPELVTVPESGE